MPTRPSPRQRGYGAAWDRLSLHYRARHPWCEICESTVDLVLDHLDERDDPTAVRSTAPDRLRVLCRGCNTRRQNEANARRGTTGRPRTRRRSRGATGALVENDP